jgi:hypothetical protein
MGETADEKNTPLGGEEMRKFLTGTFATWFATRDGREKANAKDRKLAEIVAGQATDTFGYFVDRRTRMQQAA